MKTTIPYCLCLVAVLTFSHISKTNADETTNDQSDSQSYNEKLNLVQASLILAHKSKSLENSYFIYNSSISNPVQLLQDNVNKFSKSNFRSIGDVNPKCLSQLERWFVALSNITNNPQQWAINGVNIFLLNLILISFKIFCFLL